MNPKTNIDIPAGDVVSSETALACFFRLGAQNGVYAEVGAVRRRNLIDSDTLPVARLIELPRTRSRPRTSTGRSGWRAKPRACTSNWSPRISPRN
jgi:hypothetical protein